MRLPLAITALSEGEAHTQRIALAGRAATQSSKGCGSLLLSLAYPRAGIIPSCRRTVASAHQDLELWTQYQRVPAE